MQPPYFAKYQLLEHFNAGCGADRQSVVAGVALALLVHYYLCSIVDHENVAVVMELGCDRPRCYRRLGGGGGALRDDGRGGGSCWPPTGGNTLPAELAPDMGVI